MSDQKDETPAERIERVANELGLGMVAEFVPWSKSRNADQKDPSLNWVIRLYRNGNSFLTTDYSAGRGHAPSYKQRGSNTIDGRKVLIWECENGYAGWIPAGYREPMRKLSSKVLAPKLADVLSSLASDADVIDCSTFEEWAGNLGYDPDSRKAEKIYRACLETALKIRNALGEDGLSKLREACQDY